MSVLLRAVRPVLSVSSGLELLCMPSECHAAPGRRSPRLGIHGLLGQNNSHLRAWWPNLCFERHRPRLRGPRKPAVDWKNVLGEKVFWLHLLENVNDAACVVASALFVELFAAVRTLKPYLSNGVLNSYVTNHVQLPGNMPNPRASGSTNPGIPGPGPGALHGRADATPNPVEPTPVPPPTPGSNPEQATPPVKRKRSEVDDDRLSLGAATPATSLSKMSVTAIPYFVMYEEDGTAKLLETESGSQVVGRRCMLPLNENFDYEIRRHRGSSDYFIQSSALNYCEWCEDVFHQAPTLPPPSNRSLAPDLSLGALSTEVAVVACLVNLYGNAAEACATYAQLRIKISCVIGVPAC